MIHYDNLSRRQCVVLWVMGACQELVRLGLLTGGRWRTTTVGLAVFDQLDAEWHPDNDEIEECVTTAIMPGTSSEHQSVMVRLLVLFRDDRESVCNAAGD